MTCLRRTDQITPVDINRVDYKSDHHQLDFEVITIQDFFMSRPHRMITKDYRLNFWTILYITHGQGTHVIDFKTYTYGPGDVVFVQKNQVHHYVINPHVKGYILHIKEPFFYKVKGFNNHIFLEFMDRSLGSQVSQFDLSPTSTSHQLMSLIDKEYHSDTSPATPMLLDSLFQSFILSLQGQPKPKEDLLLSTDYGHFIRFRDLVEDHYSQIKKVEAYADMMYLSSKTLNLATRRVMGLSAKTFINQRLILEIKRYLSQGDLLNYQISERLGFDEPANMTKFFKTHVGLSPKDFRKAVSKS